MSIRGLLIVRRSSTELENFADSHIFRICGKTLIEHYSTILKKFDVREIFLLAYDCKIDASEIPEDVRTVEDLSALPRDGTYLVIPCDVYVPTDAIRILVSYHTSIGADLTLLAAPCENAMNMPVLEVDTSTGKISDMVVLQEARPDIVWTGVAMCEAHVLSILVQEGTSGVRKLLREGAKLDKTYWSGSWCRIESPWDLVSLAKAIFTSEIEAGLYIHPRAKISTRALLEPKEGPIIIDEGAVIDHDVIIRGPVYIGRRVYVGNNALIRNNTVIEHETTVGSNVDITESVILERCTIGRNAYISCSVIGPDVVIEPGVVTRSFKTSASSERRHVRGRAGEKMGAVIGQGSRVGAYTVLSPGTFVKKHSVIEPLTKL